MTRKAKVRDPSPPIASRGFRALHAIARKAGLSFSTIYRMAAGKYKPTVRTQLLLRERVGLSVPDLARLAWDRNGRRRHGSRRGRKPIFTPAQQRVLQRTIRAVLRTHLRRIVRRLGSG